MQHNDAHSSILHTLLSSSYEIEAESFPEYPQEDHPYHLVDEEDRLALCHRDAHFGGSFAIMIEAYRKHRRGAVLDISLQRLAALEKEEKRLGKNIAPIILSGADAEAVGRARTMYRQLRATYETTRDPLVRAICGLILSDDEIEESARRVLAFRKKAIPFLIDCMASTALRDPLYPGYGLIPQVAAELLGKMRAKEAIGPLFELLSSDEQAFEEAVVPALRAIGKSAKEFLSARVASSPLSRSNEVAAGALLSFDDVAPFFFEMAKKFPSAGTFTELLILGCEKLPKSKHAAFKNFAQAHAFPKEIKNTLQFIITSFENQISREAL
jgi:hypothetical protein